MEKLFSDLEGLRIAMAMEERGRDFYRRAYDNAPKQEQKDVFLLLMNEEIHHYETFGKMFEQLKQNKAAHTDDYMFDPEISRYLTVLAEGHVFPGKVHKEVNFKSITEILEAAIQAEKDSVLFYDELARHSKFQEAKDIFIKLKTEEQSHIVKLREMAEGWA